MSRTRTTQRGITRQRADNDFVHVDTKALQRALLQAQIDLSTDGRTPRSLRTFEIDTGISESTLSRIANNVGIPDADTIAKLAHYLQQPIERFVTGADAKSIAYLPSEPVPQVIDALLYSDKALSTEAAAGLSELFRLAYNLAPKKENGNAKQ